jgi:hypothetical protein
MFENDSIHAGPHEANQRIVGQFRRQNDNRRLVMASTHCLRDFNAVHAAHPDIKQHQIELIVRQFAKCRLPIPNRAGYDMSMPFKRGAQATSKERMVINDQDARQIPSLPASIRNVISVCPGLLSTS